jgi:hypothetical protein
MFGIFFTLTTGCIIITLSIALDPALSVIHKRFGKKTFQHLEWRTNDAMQLQRLAHESLGAGTWTDAAEVVPVTPFGETLAVLDISNTYHPILALPQAIEDKSMQKQAPCVNAIEVAGPELELEWSAANEDQVTTATPETGQLSDGESAADLLRIPVIESDENSAGEDRDDGLVETSGAVKQLTQSLTRSPHREFMGSAFHAR